MTTTIKVKFRPSTVAGRPGNIVYILTHRRVVRQITTEYKIYPEEWDAKRSVIALIPDNAVRMKVIQSIRRKLCWDLERLRRIISNFESRIAEYSTDEIVDEYRRVMKESSLCYYMENIILRLLKFNHIGTANNYRAALGSFRRFSGGEDVMLEAIDLAMDLTERRIEAARRMLATRCVSVRSVAEHLAFGSEEYFRYIYKKITGRSPEQSAADA